MSFATEAQFYLLAIITSFDVVLLLIATLGQELVKYSYHIILFLTMTGIKELPGLSVVGRCDLHVLEILKEHVLSPFNFSSLGYITGL